MQSIPRHERTGEKLRGLLHADAVLFGSCCLSTSPKMPSALAAVGMDCVFIDTEHVPIPIDTLSWMCQVFGLMGLPPICRVSEPEPYKVCEYLDAGAVGIVAPYLETVEQVKMLVGAVKLRPLKGAKLQKVLSELKPINPSEGKNTNDELYKQVDAILGETNTSAFMKKKNKNCILLLNIESIVAVENLDALLSVPGVDSTLVGPHDLSVNYGVAEQWESKTFLDAIDKIIDGSKKYGMGCGIHYSFTKEIEYQIEWCKRGANLVMHSADVKLVAAKLREDFSHILEGTTGQKRKHVEVDVEGV